MTKVVSNTAQSDVWTATGSGNWSVATDWSLGNAPTSSEDVVIDTASPLTVTFNVPTQPIAGLDLVDDALDLTGGSLTITGATTLTNATIDGTYAIASEGSTSVTDATIEGGATWANWGTVTQSNGAVTIGDATSARGVIVNKAGAAWVITDTSGFDQGAATTSRFINDGTFQKTLGSGVAMVDVNFTSTGTIASAGGGDIEFNGKSTNLSGTYIGSGMVDYGPDGASIVGDVDVTQSCCQTNYGVVDLVGTMTMNDGSTIANNAGTRWNFDGDSSLVLAAGQSAGPIIHGMGYISKTAGTGTSVISIDVGADDEVTVSTGTLEFEGATSAFYGWIGGAGTFEIGGGQAALDSGASLAVANWTLAGGLTTLDKNISYRGLFEGEAGASLALGGETLTLFGGADFSGLTTDGAGVLHLLGKSSVSGLTIGGSTDLLDGASVMQDDSYVTLGDEVVSATTTTPPRLTIAAGATWDLDDGGGIMLGTNPSAYITIAGATSTSGLLEKTGSGESVVAPAIGNSAKDWVNGDLITYGGLEAASGTLDVQGAVTGVGSDNIVGGSTLEFDSTVGASQTVYFYGAGGTLDLTDLAGFNAPLAGFDITGSDDALLIGGGWTYLSAKETSTSATLTFANGGTHHTVVFDGDYPGGFVAQSLSGGVLKVTYSNAAA